MKIIEVSQQIEGKIKELDKVISDIESLVEKKSCAISGYDKQLAKVIIRLRSGDEFNLDGNVVRNPPTTIIEKVAKGICWEECLAKDLAETKYKVNLEKADIIKSQLNGYQSINRYLSETGG